MCFSSSKQLWKSWDPLYPSTSLLDTNLKLGLSRNHIGFHGVVCTSSQSFIYRKKDQSVEDASDSECSSTSSCGDCEELSAGSYLVMAGRLAQSVSPPSPRVSGVWLLNPAKPLEASSPTFPLPTSLDTLLYRTTMGLTATVALCNWSALEEVVDLGGLGMWFHPDSSSSAVLPPTTSVDHHLAYCNGHVRSNSRYSHALPGAGSDSD